MLTTRTAAPALVILLSLAFTAEAETISPAKLEVNLGAFPVDNYCDPPNTGVNGASCVNNSIFPNTNGVCTTSISVRECVRRFFNNNPANGTVVAGNYVSQGITGVRLFFTLGGRANSTPFTGSNHAVNSTWITQLTQLFKDLKLWGIQRVTPLPALDAAYGGMISEMSANYPNTSGCPSGSKTLYFFPWLPYGLVPNGSSVGGPDQTQGVQAYYCSPYTPSNIWWGWGPIVGTGGVIDQVLGAAATAGLSVTEFEMQNENDLENFSVEARLIYDITTGTDVTQMVGQLMTNHNFKSTGVTLSVKSGNACDSAGCINDCASLFGDSARIVDTDQLQSAFYGGVFGSPPYVSYNGTMACDDSSSHGCGAVGSQGWYACATKGMLILPGSHPVPALTDIHNNGCLLISTSNPSCDLSGSVSVTSSQTTFYNDVWGYLQYRGLTGDPILFGETNSNQPSTACNNDTPTITQQNAAGFEASTLYSSDATNVYLRPWNTATSSNCVTPILLGAPNGPYK